MAVVSIKNKLRRGNLLVGNDPYIPSDYESIATTTLNSNTTITFSNIPGTYAHLQLRIFGKTTRPTYKNDLVSLIFNDDSTVNYSSHYLYGDGSVVEAGASTGTAYMYNGAVLGSTAMSTNTFGCAIIDILDYANTNKYKTTRGLGGWDDNGSGVVGITSGSWRSTNAITKILVRGGEATNLGSGTTIALYGIKG